MVRRRLEEWKDEDFSCKVKIVEVKDFDKLTESLEGQLTNYDVLLSTMGGLTAQGEVVLTNIEYNYPAAFAKSGLSQGAKHFGILSACNADVKSSMVAVRLKGEIERHFPAFGYPSLSFARPGLITNREGERLIEKICKYIPFIPKVDSNDIAIAMFEDAILAA